MLRQGLYLKPSLNIRGNPPVSFKGQVGMQRLGLFLNQV